MTTMSYDIRQAVLADLDRLVPLFEQYRQFYGRAGDVDSARTFLRARFDHGESVLFLAEENGLALGFTQLYPNFSSLSLARTLVLNDLYVAETARRRGVGRALISAAADYGQAVGASSLSLSTAHSNVRAQELYRRTGWVRDEVYAQYRLALC